MAKTIRAVAPVQEWEQLHLPEAVVSRSERMVWLMQSTSTWTKEGRPEARRAGLSCRKNQLNY